MIRAPLLLVLAACGTPAPATAPPVAPPPVPADAAASADPAWPEPKAPVVECTFAPDVVCPPATPTRTALQPEPFASCARAIANHKDLGYPQAEAAFSALETRRARKSAPDACCYIAFRVQMCD